MFEYLIEGLSLLGNINILLLLNLGMLIGIVFGAIPGLTGNLGIIVFLPFTYGMAPVEAIGFLVSIFCGGEFGGSISAILIGTPGTNGAVATMLDGYPIAKQGHAKKALMLALLASTFGGIISSLVLLFSAPPIAAFTINFGPPEYFALGIFGLSVISGISGKNMVKGFIAGTFGMMVSIIGIDQMTGVFRFTFGNINLYRGVSLLPFLIGAFAIPSILEKVEVLFKDRQEDKETISINKNDSLNSKEIIALSPTIGRSTLIGVIIGAIPGAGTAIASFISYNEAKRNAKDKSMFGKGDPRGIVASESANNAVTSASLIPLLTLGIPGSPSAATLIGAFMIQGMVPGPGLFREQGPIVYAIMLSIILANIFMLLQGRLIFPFLSKLTKISDRIMIPILIFMCIAGSYSVNNSIFDIQVLLVSGLISYILLKLDVPLIPIVLGFVLGPMTEFNLRRSLVMSQGSWSIFITKPICLFFILLTLVLLVLGYKANKAVDDGIKSNIQDAQTEGNTP